MANLKNIDYTHHFEFPGFCWYAQGHRNKKRLLCSMNLVPHGKEYG